MPRRASARRVDPTESNPRQNPVEHIRLDDIVLGPSNPRQSLDDIDELAASIREYGLLQPVVVRRRGRKYELVAGHRRLAALRSIDWTEVPAVVRDESADRAYLLTLIENLQREDLSPREESDALAELVRARNWSTHQVADAIKRSQAYVSKRIRVFDDPLLRPAVLENRLNVSSAEELLALDTGARQDVLRQALANNWDQASVRAAVRAALGRPARPKRLPQLRTQVENLRQALRDVQLAELGEADRKALRRLFLDLSMIGRTPRVRRSPVFPDLPVVKQPPAVHEPERPIRSESVPTEAGPRSKKTRAIRLWQSAGTRRPVQQHLARCLDAASVAAPILTAKTVKVRLIRSHRLWATRGHVD